MKETMWYFFGHIFSVGVTFILHSLTLLLYLPSPDTEVLSKEWTGVIVEFFNQFFSFIKKNSCFSVKGHLSSDNGSQRLKVGSETSRRPPYLDLLKRSLKVDFYWGINPWIIYYEGGLKQKMKSWRVRQGL